MTTLYQSIESLDESETLTFTRIKLGLRIHIGKRANDGKIWQAVKIITPEELNLAAGLVSLAVADMLQQCRATVLTQNEQSAKSQS